MFIFQGVGQVAKKKWPSLVLITNCRENPLNESWDEIAVPGFLARPEVPSQVAVFFLGTEEEGTPPKFNMEPENHHLEKGKSSSKPPFFGSMLISGE